MPMHRRQEPIQFCNFCGKSLERKMFNGRLEDFGDDTATVGAWGKHLSKTRP